MSTYAPTLRSICENLTGASAGGYNDVNSTIEAAIPLIFNFDFPIYDNAYRNVLCRKIVKHYYMREICAETYGLWKLWLDTRLNEIMPYYNELYKSAMLDFNPLHDIEITTTKKSDNSGTTDTTDNRTNKNERDSINTISQSESSSDKVTGSVSDDNTHRDRYSDTPQGSLSNVEGGDYLTNYRYVTDANTKTNQSTSTVSGTKEGTNTVAETVNRSEQSSAKTVANSTEEYLETVKGKRGGVSYSKMLVEYRETIINIDTKIINDLADLFFGLW